MGADSLQFYRGTVESAGLDMPRQARRPSRHWANDSPCKSRRQVEARQAERQRMFIARLKTGERSQDTFIYARATAAASEVPGLDEHRSTETAP